MKSPILLTVRWDMLSPMIGFIEAAPEPVNRSIRLPLIAPPVSEAYQ